MVDLIEYVDAMQEEYDIQDQNFRMKVTKFFVANKWFGQKPVKIEGRLYLDEAAVKRIMSPLEHYCDYYVMDDRKRFVYMINRMSTAVPRTADIYRKYVEARMLDAATAYHLADFIATFLPGELSESTDREVATLVDDGFDEMPKVYGDLLADFINWTHDNYKTVYQNHYEMNAYSKRTDESEAYDQYDYLKILYHLFNEDFINENDMYANAAKSKNYVDTWLFMAMHFLYAIRNTDLVRIPHPILTSPPRDVLDQISAGEFKDVDARMVTYSVKWHLEGLRLMPNKTEGTRGIGSLKINFPESVEVHMGTLLAAAEAHFQLSGNAPEKPLIRVINSYEQINRYMGSEIGELFLESNFKSRAANKSYMQMIYLLTDDILEINDEFRVKGYMLSALARSHKGGYGSFAKTTVEYLKDAKMSGYSPEFVARELFERGVLSMTSSMLLKMVSGEEYETLSVENQTRAIRELDLLPAEIEKIVKIAQSNIRESTEIAKALYGQSSKDDVLKVLHRIGNGEAVSKTSGCMCLMTAMGKACPHIGKANCLNCEFEVATKTTLFVMAREVNRLKNAYNSASSEIERERSKAMVGDVVVPLINEMLTVTEEVYGPDALEALETVLREAGR